MLTPLPNIVNTYSSTSRSTVQSLIREMKVDKVEFQNTVKRMSSFSSGTSFSAARIGAFTTLDRQILVELFRESSTRLQRLFAAMNSVGLALNSIVNIFDSEVRKIEKDIENLELFVNNYEFISGKDDLYNYNYVERFSDLLGDYRFDGSDFLIPDRDNSFFPMGGNGFIDSAAGVFKFGSDIRRENVLDRIASIEVATNFDNYISTNSDPINLFNDTLLDSWNVTVKSPMMLTSSLAKYAEYLPYDTSSYTGAQVVIDVKLSDVVTIDSIRLTPNDGIDFFLMQVALFNEDERAPVNILTEPVSLRGSKEISFSRRVVNRIIFIFNQSSYLRSKPVSVTSELNSKLLNSFVQQRVQERRSKFSRHQDMFYWYFNRRTTGSQLALRKSEYDFYNYRFPTDRDKFAESISDELFANANFDLDYKYAIDRSPALIALIQNAFQVLTRDQSLIKSSSFVESYGNNSLSGRLLDYAGFMVGGKSSAYHDVKEQFYNYPIVTGGVSSTVRALLANESSDVYEYLFSLKAIELIETISTDATKACFVSRRIPSNSQITAVKARIDGTLQDLDADTKDFNLKKLLSYELSLSNKAAPTLETDWYPLAFDGSLEIEAEVLFFDISDYSAKLRFRPVSDSIFLYRDGMFIVNQSSASAFRYEPVSNKVYLTDPALYSPASIFSVRYQLDTTNLKQTELDLAANNMLYDAVKTFGDATGSGQKFNSTDSNATVVLDYAPYVNMTLIQNSIYSPGLGTLFTTDSSGYSPVRVRLEDGSFARNLTNYTGVPHSVQFGIQNTTSFIQTGRSIVFDRNINRPFEVHYDYMPDTLRFRLIVRRTVSNTKVPAKIDNLVLKMKTTNFDPYYDKLNLSTTGR